MKAIARDTLFIHGSTSGGGRKHWRPSNPGLPNVFSRSTSSEVWCNSACGTPNEALFLHGTSTTCDRTCHAGKSGSRFDGLFCGAGDPEKFGPSCRLCFTNAVEARKAELELRRENHTKDTFGRDRHVVMCDTLRPPEAVDCEAKCAMKTDTVSVPPPPPPPPLVAMLEGLPSQSTAYSVEWNND